MSGRKKPGGKQTSAKKTFESEKKTLQTERNYSAAGTTDDQRRNITSPKHDAIHASSQQGRQITGSGDTSVGPLNHPTSSQRSTFQQSSIKDRDSGQNVQIESARIEKQATGIATDYSSGNKPHGTQEGNKKDQPYSGVKPVDTTLTAPYPEAVKDQPYSGVKPVDTTLQGTKAAPYPKAEKNQPYSGVKPVDTTLQGKKTAPYPKTAKNQPYSGVKPVDTTLQGTKTAPYPKTAANRADDIAYIDRDWSRKHTGAYHDRTKK